MTRTRTDSIQQDLRTLFGLGAVGGLSDAELLGRFAGGRGDAGAEAAFAALVDRHGPTVRGVCRRVVGDAHAADDAFQATFLVLARRARSRSLRVETDGSLGGWLHGVSLRVARRARANLGAHRVRFGGLDGHDPADPRPTTDPIERADLRAAIDAEIARLPVRYRSAVVLCYLDGLTQEQAARRLRLPVGTVQSRLHRARERLRSGLTRRGLAPSVVGALGLPGSTPRAALPTGLAQATASAAVRFAAGGAVPAAVAGLAGSFLREMAMRKGIGMIAVLIGLGLPAAGAAWAVGAGQDEAPAPPGPPPAAAVVVADDPAAGGEAPSLADRLEQIRAEYEAAQRAYYELYRGSTIPEENLEKAREIRPDMAATVRRIAELASAEPKGPAARDAMLWIIHQTSSRDYHASPDGEFALAAQWLVRNFGDDPDAIRVGLDLNNVPSANRDALILGFMATAKGHESKGLARLALAQYLDIKAKMARGAREVEGRRTFTLVGVVGEDGKPYDKQVEQSDGEYAYLLHLKQCDLTYLQDESERLLDEVAAEYGDVPYITTRVRETEALLKKPNPTWNGQPLTEEDRQRAERLLERRSTLAEVVERNRAASQRLAVGQPAPEIEGPGVVDGRPWKLSEQRGKVVAVVFWGGWCGPCVREIPRERELVERMAGRPFAMLGINTDEDIETARKAIETHGVTWPNLFDGAPGEGPIARRYHIQSYPTVYVIDVQGKIRSQKSLGEGLDKLVEELVAEAEGG